MAAEGSSIARLFRRQGYQSQDIEEATLVDYWGYAARVVPCANDPGTCEYFESVYGGHERGMLYTGIIWATLGGILFIWAIGRHFWAPQRASEAVISIPSESEKQKRSSNWFRRMCNAIAATTRHYTLPDSIRLIFGRTSRLQVLILVLLTAYITVFSFVGIMYKTWMTPVKGYDNLYQKRSWLGSWSDRVGVIAYALTPFSVMLASRESILSQLTGIPYQSFNFLHRWLGWIIAIQSLIHTIGWTVIETVYYQPQPQVAEKWIKQLYMIWGCVAIILLFFLVILATPWGIRAFGYEFFRKSHYILAMVYIGACWGHWQPLKVFMVPGLAIWLFDRAARLVRSFLIHYQYLPDGSMGFQSATAEMTHFPDEFHGDVVRLDFAHPHSAWKPGQHFYLCFPKDSIWQSHPFTPLNLPIEKNGSVEHSYIFRAKKGQTKKITQMAANAAAPTVMTTPVVLQGPYGEDHILHLTPEVNVLCVAGGTGITYVLPTLIWLVRQAPTPDRNIALVWAVRRRQDTKWVRQELDLIASAKQHGINITIHITREDEQVEEPAPTGGCCGEKAIQPVTSSTSSSSSARSHDNRFNVHNYNKPKISALVPSFLEGNVRGRTVVYASGPGSMVSDLRSAVAKANSGAKVWRGDENSDVQLVCDNRLEW